MEPSVLSEVLSSLVPLRFFPSESAAPWEQSAARASPAATPPRLFDNFRPTATPPTVKKKCRGS